MNRYRAKIMIAIILAFVLSSMIKNTVFMADTPHLNDLQTISADLSAIFFPLKIITSSQVEIISPTVVPTPTTIPAIPWPPVSTKAPTSTRRPNQPAPTAAVEPTEYIPPTAIPTEPEPEPTIYEPPVDIPTEAPAGQANATMADFGKCLTAKGMVVYTQPGCSACTEQKKRLGEAWTYVKEVSCSSNAKECGSVGVRATPSWAKDGVIVIPGCAVLEQIAMESGCQLPK